MKLKQAYILKFSADSWIIIYNIARYENKQFIITSHSSVILSCVPNQSRIFIENKNGTYLSYQDKSINFILSKMDVEMYPLIDLCCEDKISKRILNKLLEKLNNIDPSYNNLINIMIIGSASDAYNAFNAFNKTFSQRKIKTGFGCVLDADMKKGYLNEKFIHFLLGEFTDKSPEKFLVEQYLDNYPHDQLEYHLKNTNAHILFQKMFELGIVNSDADDNLAAFNICWDVFIQKHSDDYFKGFKNYIDNLIEYFIGLNL